MKKLLLMKGRRHSQSPAQKLLLIMKLTFFFFLVSLLQVTATGLSQEAKVSLQVKNTSLSNVFEEIENQTDYRFVYKSDDLNRMSAVSVNVNQHEVDRVLDDLLASTSLQYRILDDGLIVITNEEKQDFTVSGKVTDQNGDPIPGVNIVEVGTNTGSITDLDGSYTISVSSEDAVLRFSFVGYLTEEIEVGGQTNIDVTMVEDIQALDEVVVVGYGTQKKVNVTGAIDVISNEQIRSRPSATVSQLLSGQSPGITLNSSRSGFLPGAELSLDIRGIGSINGGSPYILIDGFPGDLDRLNPEDIESISVLKDASASAIYGARAAYGVILVTTRSGKKNKKLTATYDGNVSVGIPMPLPKTLDSYTFARVHNEAASNRGDRYYSNETVDRIIAYQNEDWDYLRQFLPEGATHFETVPDKGGVWAYKWKANANNDWLDIMLGDAINHKHNFSVDGGTDNIIYYFSAGYLYNEGIINYADDKFDRFNILGKITTSLAEWWDFSYESRIMKSNKTYPTFYESGQTREFTGFYNSLFSATPTNALYDGFGNIYARHQGPGKGAYNIIDRLKNAFNDIESTENWHNFATEIRPVKGWKINGDFAYRSFDQFRSDIRKVVYYPIVSGDFVPDPATIPNNIRNYHQSNYYWTTNVYSSFTLNLESGHNLSVMGGMQFEYDKLRRFYGEKSQMIVEDVPSLETAIGEPIVSERLRHWSTQGYFGRFTYNFKEKYLLESNVRYDGTSRYREGNRWGLFPSFSSGWVLSKENFWAPLSEIVNTFKIRASWGQLGNQNVAPYQDLALIPLNSGQLNWLFEYGGTRPVGYTGTPSLTSPDLTWETVTTKNIGINTGFFDQKLQFDFDVFERTTTDMIGPTESKPNVLGSAVPESNNAALRTRGWEAVIRWKQNLISDFSYYINLNIYDNVSEITEYNNPDKLIDDWYVGKEVGEIWGYESNGLFQSQEEIDNHADQSFMYGSWNTGDIKYEDLNGDGFVNNGENTLDNPGDLKIIGNRSPRYQFGISAGADYKGFDFSMLWRGVAKRDIDYHMGGSYGGQTYFGFVSQSWSAIYEHVLDYYRDQPGDKYTGLYEGEKNINTDAWLPRPYVNRRANDKDRFITDHYLLSGAYIRLQNIQLGYSLPSKITSKLGLSKLRLYFSGENLLTFSDLPPGVDPQAVSGFNNYLGYTYAADRIFSFGLSVSF